MIQRRNSKPVFSNLGDRFQVTFRSAFNKDNVLELIEAGKIDVYNEIQSHADSVDINAIIARASAGDVAALNRRQPLYFDATEFPQTYAEMYQKIIDATNYFESLPLDVRDKFGHSPETFFASIGTDLFEETMKDYLGLKDAPILDNLEGGETVEPKPE